MQDIDPIYFATPVAVTIVRVGLVVCWRFRRRLTGSVMLYASSPTRGRSP